MFKSWFSTHPALETRILQILPRFDLKAPMPSRKTQQSIQRNQTGQPQSAEQIIQNSIAAAESLQALPMNLLAMAHDPTQVPALLLSLMAQQDRDGLSDEARLQLINIAAPSLRTLVEPARSNLALEMQQQAQMDGLVTPFEILLMGLACNLMDAGQHLHAGPKQADLVIAAGRWLSYLAAQGAQSRSAAEQAFNDGAKLIPTWALTMDLTVTGQHAFEALQMFRLTGLRQREALVRASRRVISSDDQVTAREALLLQALMECLS